MFGRCWRTVVNSGRWWTTSLVVLAAVATTAGLMWAVVRSRPPGTGSVEVGFAQDMSVHHAQAVAMAGLVMERTDDEATTTLARDIQLTQQAQIGQMHGWLDLWDQPTTTVGPRMTWMSLDGEGVSGRMPGMASPEELGRLRDARGAEAERLFLQLMIDHHQSGMAMAAAAVERASLPEVRRLAEAMVSSQQVELEAMRRMLDDHTD